MLIHCIILCIIVYETLNHIAYIEILCKFYLDKVFKVDNMNIQVLVVTDETLPFVVVVEIVVEKN